MDWIIVAVGLVVISALVFFYLKSSKKSAPEIQKEIKPSPAQTLERKIEQKVEAQAPAQISTPVKVLSWKDRLAKGLSRTRTEVFGKIESLISGNKLSIDQLDSVEEILYTADIGPQTVSELIDALKKQVKEKDMDTSSLKKFLYQFLFNKMENVQTTVDKDLYRFDKNKAGATKVIMVVGVNGAGKTTTIGKLATKLKKQGANVVVGACDTFRAAAVDQLAVWCERAGAQMVRAADGSDPSGVAYEALQRALNEKADYCILDTAGRLHTKTNLMDELAKTKRVLGKLDSSAPHAVLLVIDSITGQNALKQAEEFNKALNLTGLVFTKCDGSAKAGNAISIVNNLRVPITYIGVGEEVEDLEVFDLSEYLNSLLGIGEEIHSVNA